MFCASAFIESSETGTPSPRASDASASSIAARISTCFFFRAEDGIRDLYVTGVQTCALPISATVLLWGFVAAVIAWSPISPWWSWPRSEERRVGKECRSRGAPYHEKKKSDEGVDPERPSGTGSFQRLLVDRCPQGGTDPGEVLFRCPGAGGGVFFFKQKTAYELST